MYATAAKTLCSYGPAPTRLFCRPTVTVACGGGGGRKYSTLAVEMLLTATQMPVVFEMMGLMVGHMTGTWWQTRSSETRRKRYAEWALGFALVAAGTFAAHMYGQYVHTDPDTGRRKLLLFREDTVVKLAEKGVNMLLQEFSTLVIDNEDPKHKRVVRIVEKVLDANREISAVGDRKVTVIVINKPKVGGARLLLSFSANMSFLFYVWCGTNAGERFRCSKFFRGGLEYFFNEVKKCS